MVFGSAFLTSNDLNSFPCSIVMLGMDGIALGSAVSSSGLLWIIAAALQKQIQDQSLYAILFIFGILLLVIGAFVSHTVSVIIPFVQEVGDPLPSDKAAPILVFACCLVAAPDMELASSGFPNAVLF